MPRAKARHDGEARIAERRCELGCKTTARKRGLAGADDSKGAPAEQRQIADRGQNRRRIGQGGQRGRVARVTHH
jgi:hypothetical protein